MTRNPKKNPIVGDVFDHNWYGSVVQYRVYEVTKRGRVTLANSVDESENRIVLNRSRFLRWASEASLVVRGYAAKTGPQRGPIEEKK